MAVTTYAELQTALDNWLARTDLQSRHPEFIALAEARRMKLALPGLALAHELYVALQAQGGGRNGTQALLLALARLSDVDWTGH